VAGICETVQPEVLDMLWWDTKVAGHQTFLEGEYADLLTQAKPKGGGGTDFACVPEHLTAERMHPDCLIVLTDGYVTSWGVAPDCPTLFAITGYGTAPYGVSIKL
jgi:predicted metal-dependent peptidase